MVVKVVQRRDGPLRKASQPAATRAVSDLLSIMILQSAFMPSQEHDIIRQYVLHQRSAERVDWKQDAKFYQ